jgi:hypothetical protein
MSKIDYATCSIDDLPNGWDDKNYYLIKHNEDVIIERIRRVGWQEEKLDRKDIGKFMGKFYNRIGEPCPPLRSMFSEANGWPRIR